jgi:hypothetical protein
MISGLHSHKCVMCGDIKDCPVVNDCRRDYIALCDICEMAKHIKEEEQRVCPVCGSTQTVYDGPVEHCAYCGR